MIRLVAFKRVWLISPSDRLLPDELEILRGADRAFDIRASGDHGSRFGLAVFGSIQATTALKLIAQLPDAIEQRRLMIADAEKQPAAHTAQMLQDALRPAAAIDVKETMEAAL